MASELNLSTMKDQHKEEDSPDSGADQANQASARNPACDLCREKKVKCGREKPSCKNCRTWKVSCTYSERQKRENESSRIAQKFEEVHERLDRLESTMQRIAVALELSNMTVHHQQQQANSYVTQMMHNPLPPASYPIVSPSPSRESFPNNTPVTPARSQNGFAVTSNTRLSVNDPQLPQKTLVKDTKGNVHYLGASSLLSISTEAEHLAEAKLSAATGDNIQSGAAEAMGVLRGLNGLDKNIANLLPYDGYMELKMGGRDYIAPSRDEAIRLIDCFFDRINRFFPLFRYETFMKNVNKMYENPSAMSDRGWLVCFNNVLLFSLYGTGSNKKEDIQIALVEKYFFNSWAAFDDVSILLTPSLINVQALLTLAIVAQEISKPGLCWMLLSQACRLAQAIGLHRQSHPSQITSEEESQERKLVFWTLYIMDKALSLTFGRSTCLPDFDVDVDLPEYGNPLSQHFASWVWLAKIQSQIYMRLYSASGCRSSDEERQRAAAELELDLRNWWAQNGASLEKMPSIGLFEQKYVEMEIKFCFHNSMIMIHRVNRGGGELSEVICLNSARTSVHLIKQTLTKDSGADGSVLLWLFQYFPFTPFFILFSNVVRNPEQRSSRDDFELMQVVVSYLEKMKAANENASKLHKIAAAFTQIAAAFLKKYVQPEAKKRKHSEVDGLEDGVEDGRRNPPAFREQFPQPPLVPSQHEEAFHLDSEPVDVSTLFPHAFNFLRWSTINTVARPSSSHNVDTEEPLAGNVPTLEGFDFDIEALMAEPVDFQSQMQQAHRQGPLDFDWFQWDQYTQGLGDSPGQSAYTTLPGQNGGLR